MGADVSVNYRHGDPVAQIMELTGGRGVDRSIEACGKASTFRQSVEVLKPGGHAGILGVFSEELSLPSMKCPFFSDVYFEAP